MAEIQLGGLNLYRFTNKQRMQTSGTQVLNSPANFASVNAMRSALATADGITYTSAMLNKMTTNDMVYALRVLTENNIAADGTI